MAGATKFVWRVPPERLAKGLDDWLERALSAAFVLAQVFAARIETYAKQHAPWTDRTTHARGGLTGRAFRSATGITIMLFHTMEYGIWLEVANAGRYGIIIKSLQDHYGKLMQALQRLVR